MFETKYWKTQSRDFLQISIEDWYIHLDCDSTILGKTTIYVLSYGKFHSTV